VVGRAERADFFAVEQRHLDGQHAGQDPGRPEDDADPAAVVGCPRLAQPGQVPDAVVVRGQQDLRGAWPAYVHVGVVSRSVHLDV
jgi:hypothetical protein